MVENLAPLIEDLGRVPEGSLPYEQLVEYETSTKDVRTGRGGPWLAVHLGGKVGGLQLVYYFVRNGAATVRARSSKVETSKANTSVGSHEAPRSV